MFTDNFTFIRNNIICSGSGDFFEDFDKNTLTKFYHSWKSMNEVNLTFDIRRINLPEILSEGLASMIFSWVRTNGTTISGGSSSSCDLIDLDRGKLIQLKGASTVSGRKPGPTSFGPRTEFDELIFMHLNCDTDTAYFYQLDAETYKDLKVNQTETVRDQQAQGRRPRLNLLDKVQEENLEPIAIYHFD